jgi:hypothetical protein
MQVREHQQQRAEEEARLQEQVEEAMRRSEIGLLIINTIIALGW